MDIAFAILVAFRALEEGQHIVIAPAPVARLRPEVVILFLAAHIEQPVDRGRTAQRLAPRPVERASVQARIGLGLVAPVGVRIVQRLEIPDRDMDPRIDVAAARLQQKNAAMLIHGQAVRKHAAGGTRADDDVVIGHQNATLRRGMWRATEASGAERVRMVMLRSSPSVLLVTPRAGAVMQARTAAGWPTLITGTMATPFTDSARLATKIAKNINLRDYIVPFFADVVRLLH